MSGLPLPPVQEALNALARFTNYERTRADGPRAFDLSRPRALLDRLGAPDRRIGQVVVQVAGTKGKGSVSRFLDSILRAAGRRTGRFLSPHLERVEERIAVDGELIPEADFARCVFAVVDRVSGAAAETTFFEALLAAACLYFAERETEAAVLEVGLGGRLDATTAVPATCTVVTEISFDHCEILGDTLEEIAAEKAGVVRPGVPLFCGVDPASGPGRVLFETARRTGAPFHPVPPPEAQTEDWGIRFGELRLPLLGLHQAHNAALAAAAARACGIGEEAVAAGLLGARQPACCELFAGSPPVLLDGAHNDASIRALLDALSRHYPGATPALVFALARDKNAPLLSSLLAPAAGPVFCTRADLRRGAEAAALADLPAWSNRATAVEPPAEALRLAREAAGPDGLVVATGSLYLAGALRPLLRAT